MSKIAAAFKLIPAPTELALLEDNGSVASMPKASAILPQRRILNAGVSTFETKRVSAASFKRLAKAVASEDCSPF